MAKSSWPLRAPGRRRIDDNYTISKGELGKGSYGTVCQGTNKRTGVPPFAAYHFILGITRFLQIFTDFYRSLEGSFSAGSTATIATKYSFFQVFRDLQNYLAKFSRILQNFAKNQRFSQKSALFLQKSGNFAKILQIFAIFCKILQLFQKIS